MPNIDLNPILKKLDPQNIADLFLIGHAISRRKYPVGNIKVSSYKEFVKRITQFYQYHYKNVIRTNVIIPEDLAWSKALEILERGFGDLRGAYAEASTGLNNGIEACFDKIYDHFKKEHVNLFFNYVLTTDIDPLNFPERIELMRQLRQRFSGSVPAPYDVMSAIEMAADYQNFIRLYIEGITPLRLRIIK